MPSTPSNSDESIPYPPRFWWTKRIAAAFLGVLLALTGAWGLWWKVAAQRLEREIAALRARGERIFPEEFNLPSVPDDQNVAEYLNQAIAAASQTAISPRASDMEYPAYLPMSAEWISMAKTARAGNAKSLALIKQARKYSASDWKYQISSPVYGLLLPSLNGQRHLANLLGDMAVLEHIDGNDAEAMDRLLELLHSADTANHQPFLVCQLVSIGIYGLGMASIDVIGPGLRLEGDATNVPTTQPVTPARREQVQTLIQKLVARTSDDRMRRAFETERMAALDTTQWMTASSVLLKPMYRLNSSLILREIQPVIAAASQTNLPASNLVASTPKTFRSQPGWSNAMANIVLPSYNRAMETDFRARADAAMSAVILAARLYRADHNGQWPPNLDALVPGYLPSVPIDPMSGTSNPLGFIVLNNGTRPMVYSVGPDDYDDTKRGSLPPATPQVEYMTSTADQWRDLSRFDPPAPATIPAGQ